MWHMWNKPHASQNLKNRFNRNRKKTTFLWWYLVCSRFLTRGLIDKHLDQPASLGPLLCNLSFSAHWK